jgi:hypothetical protein
MGQRNDDSIVTCSSGVTNGLMSHEASAGDAPGVSRINAGLLFLEKSQ